MKPEFLLQSGDAVICDLTACHSRLARGDTTVPCHGMEWNFLFVPACFGILLSCFTVGLRTASASGCLPNNQLRWPFPQYRMASASCLTVSSSDLPKNGHQHEGSSNPTRSGHADTDNIRNGWASVSMFRIPYQS